MQHAHPDSFVDADRRFNEHAMRDNLATCTCSTFQQGSLHRNICNSCTKRPLSCTSWRSSIFLSRPGCGPDSRQDANQTKQPEIHPSSMGGSKISSSSACCAMFGARPVAQPCSCNDGTFGKTPMRGEGLDHDRACPSPCIPRAPM